MDVAQPFAEEIMAEDMTNPSNSIFEQLTRQASSFTNTSLNLPQRLEDTLNRLEQGDLKMCVNSVEANRELRQLNTLVRAMVCTILFSVFFDSVVSSRLAPRCCRLCQHILQQRLCSRSANVSDAGEIHLLIPLGIQPC